DDLNAARTGLTVNLRIGAVPTAVTFAAQATTILRRAHPSLAVEIRSASADHIQRGLTDLSLDIGVTYLRTELPPGLESRHLYDERYVLISPRSLVDTMRADIPWVEAAELPLCLLSTDMTNRKILDGVFEGLGVRPDLAFETNAFTAALVQASAGLAATIAPNKMVETLPIGSQLISLPLIEPDVAEPIGVVMAKQDPPSQTTTALISACVEAAS
ncbi:MAG: LysR family transcriptional regulator substrate-binding protein, partial [Pseudomonadota bacterium]